MSKARKTKSGVHALMSARPQEKTRADEGSAPNANAGVVTALSAFLGSTYGLYHKTLFYHWNVTGSHFFSLHKLFEEHYQELQEAGDEIAERLRALGAQSPGTMTQFIKSSSVEEDRSLPSSARAMIDNLLEAHDVCSREAHKVAKKADDAGDIVTNDMMVKRVTFHDKAAWMLRALEV